MVLAVETDGAVGLGQGQALETAAPDPGGTFERIAAASGDEQEVVVRAEPGREPGERLEPDEVATDPGRRGEAHKQLDEQARRVARGIRPQSLACQERRHVAEAHPSPDDRAVGHQRGPVDRLEALPVDAARPAEEALGAGHGARGTQNRVVDDERGDGGPADRRHGAFAAAAPHLDGSRYRPAAIALEEALELGPGPGGGEDRLLLGEEPCPGDPPVARRGPPGCPMLGLNSRPSPPSRCSRTPSPGARRRGRRPSRAAGPPRPESASPPGKARGKAAPVPHWPPPAGTGGQEGR